MSTTGVLVGGAGGGSGAPPATPVSTRRTAAAHNAEHAGHHEKKAEMMTPGRVHAQRKFAQGQSGPASGPPTPAAAGPTPVNSSGSSTRASAAPPPPHTPSSAPSSHCSSGSGHGASPQRTASGGLKPGQRPKTEDFLTFLCLRGTNLLPQELDFFNQPSLSHGVETSSDESSEPDDKVAAGSSVAKKTVSKKREGPSQVKKIATGPKLPASMQALKKKYTDQRIAKRVVTKNMTSVRQTRSSGSDAKSKSARAARALRREAKSGRRSPTKSNVTLTTRQPSAATLMAKRKSRMATFNAASSRVSRMLTRLTPRGTSNDAFIKSTKKIPLNGRSLRGRDISASSEEEDEVEAEPKKTKTPPKRKLKSRHQALAKKSENSESDADEETSSRDSSRKPSNRASTGQVTTDKRRAKGEPLAYKKSSKRDSRSMSRDSSGSKESVKSENSSVKPGRKAKEAVCLNILSKNLTSTKDDDGLSTESVCEMDGEDQKVKRRESAPTLVTKKIIKPAIRKVVTTEDKDKKSSSDDNESERKKRREKEQDKDKRKPKSSLKELRDVLLEEAKRKIGTTPPAANAMEAESSTNESDERITISQRTGYIQVKPRKSIDQLSGDERSHTPGSLIGPDGRRLSKTGERTATPPRKILPKGDLDPSRSSSSPAQCHIPVGVVASSQLSATPTSIKPGMMSATPIPGVPILHQQVPITSSNALTLVQNNQVPLTQPLVINTSFANGGGAKGSNPSVFTASGIIVSNTGIRMPVQVPIQMRPGNVMGASGNQPMPIINTSGGFQIAGMQQLTMSGGIIQPVNTISVSTPSSNVLRTPYGYPQQIVAQQFPFQPLPPPQAQASVAFSRASGIPVTLQCTTAVPAGVLGSNTGLTTSNTQPLLSPGPPMLSPQIHGKSSGAKNNGDSAKTAGNPAPNLKLASQPANNQANKPSDITQKPNPKPQSQPKPPKSANSTIPKPPLQKPQQPQLQKNHPMLPTHPHPQQLSQVRYGLHPGFQHPPNVAGYGVYRHVVPSNPQPQSQVVQTSKPQNTPKPPTPKPPTPTSTPPQVPVSHPGKVPTPTRPKSQKPIFSKTNETLLKKAATSSCAATTTTNNNTNTISSGGSLNTSTPTSSTTSTPSNSATATFKVEDESSPYAFDTEHMEKPSAPFRKSKETNKVPQLKTCSPALDVKTEKKVVKTEILDKPASPPVPSTSSEDIQCDLENASGSSIPIPKELASQLAAQAKKEGKGGNSEMTYFIPLQSSSGQSFGVAVKLGTEGPAGPNQKVIMKAKLVTQPTGKPIGSKVLNTKALEKTLDMDKPKVQNRFTRMPMASPASADSESDDSQPSTSTGRIGSPDSGRSSAMRRKYNKQRSTREENECCLGEVEVMDRFPKLGQHAHLVEAPVYQPSEAEFKDPMKYIERIRKDAEPFGFCKIIPPSSFRPECNVDDDMRFTSYSQYIQKMMDRWGSHSKEMAAIKKYLDTQNITIKPHPTVSSVEIDLPALYHAVQSFGGLTEVIQRKRWGKIADYLRIPKGTQDRGNKLDDIYCKYLLPYDTLSEVEREELLRLVEEEHEERLKEMRDKLKNQDEDADNDEEEEESEDEDQECVVKGKSTSLGQFFRVARNVLSLIFKQPEPEPREVEEDYWRIVIDRDGHVQVHQGSIDTGDEGFGFPTSKNSSCGRHPWNLKILSNNPKSLLRCMGPVMGVTVPTLNVGMVFTSGCWYRDPHGLPWVEYLHTGASKIWYGIPESHSIAFYTAMKKLVPTLCRNKKIWLPADTTMVPPNLLVKYGVSVCRTIQEPGQFLVVFPKSYSSYICTGYSLSESVYYAPKDYLNIALEEFQNIQESREPMMFPFPKLIICIAQDEMSTKDTLQRVKPFLEKIRDNEYVKHTMIRDLGVKTSERIKLRSKKQEQDDEYECEICSENLYVSYVCDVKEDTYYCLNHAIEYLQDRKQTLRKNCKILYTHSKEEICSIIKDLNKRLVDSDDDESSSDEEIEVKRTIEKKKPMVPRPVIPHDSQPMSPNLFPMLSPSSSSSKGKAPAKRKTADLDLSPPIVLPKPPAETKKKPKNAKELKESKTAEPVEKKAKKAPVAKKRKREEEPLNNPPVTSSSSSKKRNVKARKASHNKSGNLTVELLDMLLSESESDSDASDSEAESSDESWK